MASAACSREGTALEKDRLGKLFIRGLNIQTDEKALEAAFRKFGPMMEVVLLKHRGTDNSRGFAFITFESPEDAKAAAKAMNGKFLDGKAIKVEENDKPSFARDSRRRPPLPSRNRDSPRILRSGRTGRGEERGSPSRGVHMDDGGHILNLNLSSSKGPYPVKRGPSSRSGSAPPKTSARSDAGWSNSGVGRQGPVLYGRKKYRRPPHREPVSSRRKYCVTPRDGGYSTKDSYRSRDNRSSNDYKGYAVKTQPRGYRDYSHSRTQDEHSSSRHSDRDGCGGGRDRDYSEHTRRDSYRDSYGSYGNSRGVPPARGPPLTYDRSGRYNDYYTREGGWHEKYSSSRSDTSLSGHGSGGRKEQGFSPSMDRVYSIPHESYSSSSYRVSRGVCRGSRSERSGRNRY